MKSIKVETKVRYMDGDSFSPCSASERDEVFTREFINEYPEGFLPNGGYPEAAVIKKGFASEELMQDYNEHIKEGYCDRPETYVCFLLSMGEDGLTEPYEKLAKEFYSYYERVQLVSKNTGKILDKGFILKQTQ